MVRMWNQAPLPPAGPGHGSIVAQCMPKGIGCFPSLSGLRVVTSTTSTVGPNDRVAAPPVVDQYVQASGQSAQAAALHHTSPTSTSHQLVPGLRQCRSMRVRAPLPQPLPLRSPSVSS